MNALPKDLCFYAREGQTVLPGDHFSIFTYIKEVAVKECQKSYQIQLGGELEVYRVEGRFCFAKILYNYTEISKGDPISLSDPKTMAVAVLACVARTIREPIL